MALLVSVPCIVFEDEHLLVVNKPAGLNTHAPAPFAGEGIYDWLRYQEPRWSRLAIIHRLDKETSGVMAFSKTEPANRSLTQQFTEHRIQKKYLLLTDRQPAREQFMMKSTLVRAGEKYVSRPLQSERERAETKFRVISSSRGQTLIEAQPVTGKTHQIRVHAAASGFPILGDTLYGGAPAARVHLHAVELTLKHPINGQKTTFTVPADFSADTRPALRSALIDPKETNAYRLIHGASDGWPGWYVDRLGDFLLSQSEQPLTDERREALADWLKRFALRGAYHKLLTRQVRRTAAAEASPRHVLGEEASTKRVVQENGVQYTLSFDEGYSVGLFLDQRANRRRFLTSHVAAGFPLCAEGLARAEVLNTFAYTCGFSVCAARAGARTTSLDLSKKYLEWGKRNFALNDLDPAQHDFIYGDAFDWFRRLARKRRMFDVLVLDPPTFSKSKEFGTFQAGKDYSKLVTAAVPLLKPNGVLFASANALRLTPEKFMSQIEESVRQHGRKILQQHYAPQPPDYPISRDEPAHLKTVWFRVN